MLNHHTSITRRLWWCGIVLITTMSSCNKGREVQKVDEDAIIPISNEAYNNLPAHQLITIDTIYRFDEEYPIGLKVINNQAIVILAKSDSSLMAIDTHSGHMLWKSGRVGSGPQDLVSPDFIRAQTIESDTLRMYDYNSLCTISLNVNNGGIRKESLPELLTKSLNVNQRDSHVVATLKGAGAESAFYIYNNDTNSLNNIARPFAIPEHFLQKLGVDVVNYIASANVFADFDYNRIYVPFYMLDAVYIYNFNGKLLNQVWLTDPDATIERRIDKLIHQEDYVGYSAGVVHNGYCYLKRNRFDGKSQSATKSNILKFGTDGNPQAIFVSDNVMPVAYDVVDDEIFYFIVASTLNDEEVFYLLKMKSSD